MQRAATDWLAWELTHSALWVSVIALCKDARHLHSDAAAELRVVGDGRAELRIAPVLEGSETLA